MSDKTKQAILRDIHAALEILSDPEAVIPDSIVGGLSPNGNSLAVYTEKGEYLVKVEHLEPIDAPLQNIIFIRTR